MHMKLKQTSCPIILSLRAGEDTYNLALILRAHFLSSLCHMSRTHRNTKRKCLRLVLEIILTNTDSVRRTRQIASVTVRFAHRFAHVRSTEGWRQNPHVPRTPPGMETFQLHWNSWSIMSHYVSLRRVQTKKQTCKKVKCERIWRCFKFNQFLWRALCGGCFQSLLLYELLSDSHLPSLKVAGLCVSLFTPVPAFWKYPRQKQVF